MTARENQLRRRIHFWTWMMIIGLVVAGLTAVPLETELNLLVRWLGAGDGGESASGLTQWIVRVRDALRETNAKFPFLAYGTDWLAFAHLVIAVAFLGALRHPVRNLWLFQFGMIASVMIIPWALITGEVRGIPPGWRLIDCSFAIGGFVPCWLCLRWAKELERTRIETRREEL
jgi:hypothetical protein